MAYPTSSTSLGNIVQASDGAYTETFTIPTSAPYTHQIGAAAPYNYPPGWQIIPPSGVSNAVTITGAAHAAWTSVASNPTAGQFVYDSTISPTGGTLTFAPADANAVVTATWIGSTDINKTLMQALVTALKDIGAAAGAANGLATLNAASALVATATAGALALGGKLIVPDAGGLTGASPFAAGSAASGNFPVASGAANGTVYQVNTSACALTSRVILIPSCGVATNWWIMRSGISAGNFQALVSTRDTSPTSAAGSVDWFVIN